MNNRLVDVAYESVIKELQRPDCSGEQFIEQMPNYRDVECVLEDEMSVRYFIYTKDSIFILYIDCNHDYDFIDGKMQASDDEDWDLIILPRQTPFKSVTENAKQF